MNQMRQILRHPAVVLGVIGAAAGVISSLDFFLSGAVFGIAVACFLVFRYGIPLRRAALVVCVFIASSLAAYFTGFFTYMSLPVPGPMMLPERGIYFPSFLAGFVGALVIAIGCTWVLVRPFRGEQSPFEHLKGSALILRTPWIGAVMGIFVVEALLEDKSTLHVMLVFCAWQGLIAASLGYSLARRDPEGTGWR